MLWPATVTLSWPTGSPMCSEPYTVVTLVFPSFPMTSTRVLESAALIRRTPTGMVESCRDLTSTLATFVLVTTTSYLPGMSSFVQSPYSVAIDFVLPASKMSVRVLLVFVPLGKVTTMRPMTPLSAGFSVTRTVAEDSAVFAPAAAEEEAAAAGSAGLPSAAPAAIGGSAGFAAAAVAAADSTGFPLAPNCARRLATSASSALTRASSAATSAPPPLFAPGDRSQAMGTSKATATAQTANRQTRMKRDMLSPA